jgi:hypothetical protein
MKFSKTGKCPKKPKKTFGMLLTFMPDKCIMVVVGEGTAFTTTTGETNE